MLEMFLISCSSFSTVKLNNQANKAPSDSPAGGTNRKKKDTANGIAAQYMYGCLRPQRDRVKSDREPTRGSVMASTHNAMSSANPAREPERPSTWL